MEIRGVEERLAWFLSHKPSGPNRCAEYVMWALDAPRQGFPTATAVAARVVKDGNMRQGPVPKGAIRYWNGGADGAGHVAIEAVPIQDPAACASVDVFGGGTVGVKPFPWFKANWPKLRYLGWSWWWGGIDTEPTVAPPEPPVVEPEAEGLWKWYSGKPSGEQVVYPDGDWHRLKGLDEPASGIVGGSEHRFLYLRLEFTPTRTADRVVETKFVRANGDTTAMDSEQFGTVKDSYPYQNQHMEDGDGGGGSWWVKVTGGKDPITLTTRYAKCHTIYVE